MAERIQPALIASGCIEEQVGHDDGEHGPSDGLASRKDERQKGERDGEQQAMGVGAVIQGLECRRANATRGDYVIEIQRGATDER
jgi:hypothetical protein